MATRMLSRLPKPTSLGVLREVKRDHKGRLTEFRVIFTPDHVRIFKKETGLPVFVEPGLGDAIGASARQYAEAGARFMARRELLKLPLVIGVKEPQMADYQNMVNNILEMYLHLAASKKATDKAVRTSLKQGTTFVAYETMQDESGRFPTLSPMSEAAAEIVSQMAAMFLLRPHGIGLIPSGLPQHSIPGVKAAVLGGGTVGETSAIRLAKMGMRVTVIEKDVKRREKLKRDFFELGLDIKVYGSTIANIKKAFKGAHVAISGIYNKGTNPPKLITKEILDLMAEGAIFIDVAIDQGGSLAKKAGKSSILEPEKKNIIPGTHVWYFAPANIPSMGARHTSPAIGNAVLPYTIKVARMGLIDAALADPAIASGINIFNGHICCEGLAKTFGYPYVPFRELIRA